MLGTRRLVAVIVTTMLSVGCSEAGTPGPSSPPVPRAADTRSYVTGYRSIESPSGTQQTAGPITVAVSAAEATRIEQLVSALPTAHGPYCMEPAALTYKIELNQGAATRQVVGYLCAAAVSVTPRGGKLTWRRDTSCALDNEVRRLVPSAARGTKGTSVGCG
jgi:hypothetical protein